MFVDVKSKRNPLYFAHAMHTLFAAGKLNFSILSGNFLLRESPFCIINCLMSFDYTLFFAKATH